MREQSLEAHYSILKVKELEVSVHLGVSHQEQAVAQDVVFNIEINFQQRVSAESSDQIEHTVDYFTLAKVIKQTAQSRNFFLIENLCSSVADEVQKWISSVGFKTQLTTEVVKFKTPLTGKSVQVSWICHRTT